MSQDRMASASAPCSFTILGYNYLDYRGTAVNIALDKMVKCTTRLSDNFTVNGEALDANRHPLVRASLIHGWSDIDKPVSFEIDDMNVPDNVCGYQSAVVISALSSLSMMNDHLIFEDIARKGSEVLQGSQNFLGPLDLSAAINGSAILSTRTAGNNLLWSIENGANTINIHNLDIPDMTFVLGFLGKYENTGNVSAKVKSFINRQRGFTKDIFKDSNKLAEKGLKALKDRDMRKVGKLMSKTDKLTTILGIYTPELKELARTCGKHSLGTRLCFEGQHGFLVNLTDEPEKLSNRIIEAGGRPLVAGISRDGLQLN
ncbi:MAG: hypothetical protein KAS67_03370 [Thermoplasmata archaeon]|nr:hypothetical protein [Thermoplasmata archaeon]